MDLSGKGRRSRRGSLDIYAAEYALKIGNKKNITNMQQTNSFHMKVDDEDYVCPVCQYMGHTEAVHKEDNFAQRRAVVDALGWEPFQDWFYDNQFRSKSNPSL